MSKIETSKLLVVIAKKQHDALKDYAKERGRTVSEIVRDLVDEKLGNPSPINEGIDNLLGTQYKIWKQVTGRTERFDWWLVNVRYKDNA